MADPQARPSLSVVIPVFNGEASLRALVERLVPVLREATERFEILLVNDCSRDGSWFEIQRLVRERPEVRGLDLMRNYGQHNALLCGIRLARFEVVVTMDDDLQHPPEEIPALLERLTDECDVVYGTPQNEQHGLLRDLASVFTKVALDVVVGAKTARMVSAFRVFRCSLREAFGAYRGAYVSLDVLLTWGTTRFAAVPVRHEPRRSGQTNYTVLKLVRQALTMLTGYSALPLKLAALAGFGFTLFGLIILGYVLIRYLIEGTSVPGFPFLASIITIFSGAQLFALGILGEYVGRIFGRSMDQPTYVVRREAIGPPARESSNG